MWTISLKIEFCVRYEVLFQFRSALKVLDVIPLQDEVIDCLRMCDFTAEESYYSL